MRTATICTGMLLAGLLAGCGNYTEPVARTRELAPAEKNFQSLWTASLHVLRDYRFTPATQDPRDGLIVTRPETSGHFTEFWRRDASTGRDVAENSLQTIFRTVTVRIAPAEPGSDRYKAAIRVDVTRSDRREPLVTSTSQAYALFGQTEPRKLQVGYGDEEKKAEIIVQLGRDEKLEARLAEAIRAASGQSAAAQPATQPASSKPGAK